MRTKLHRNEVLVLGLSTFPVVFCLVLQQNWRPMTKLAFMAVMASLTLVSLSKIDQSKQVSYAPVVQAGGSGSTN